MYLISHRGNIDGPCENENQPGHLSELLHMFPTLHIEIDVWRVDGDLYLGHDAPAYKVDDVFIRNARFWCHAKNLESFEHMLNDKQVHCFWHQSDDFTLTSRGFIWTYPGRNLTRKSVCLMPEWHDFEKPDVPVAGICSDFILRYL